MIAELLLVAALHCEMRPTWPEGISRPRGADNFACYDPKNDLWIPWDMNNLDDLRDTIDLMEKRLKEKQRRQPKSKEQSA